MFRKIIPGVLILALASMACGFQVNLPTVVTPGPATTDQISVPLPADTTQTVDMTLSFGAGTMNVHPGGQSLVSGTATYNIPDFKPTVTASGTTVSIEQGNWHMNGIPDVSKIKNEWDLALGNVPLNLTINGGAYNATYEFGGLSLKNLTIKDGAAQSVLDFSSPNAADMSLLHYETGASNVTITGLGNANFNSLEFTSGAGNYKLDFSGALKRDGSVHITSGVSSLTLVIPEGIPVQVNTSGLANVTYGSGWTKNGNVLTQTGSGPQLVIVVGLGAGTLNLTR
jgi:hypothetical protein